MDVALLIRQRMKELGLEQRDLAAAAHVTESYISQLLARKKAPAPGRTEIYEKIGEALRLPRGELSVLADVQRQDAARRRAAESPKPLHRERRESVLEKCSSASRKEVRWIFEKQSYGELERLVTVTLLRIAGVDSDVQDDDILALQSKIDCWDIDLQTFAMEVVLVAESGLRKRFAFSELPPLEPLEHGLAKFLADRGLSGDATDEEIAFLKSLRFGGKKPSALYYYRELQSLRDPLHFPVS